MRQAFSGLLRRLVREEDGNIFILFGLSLIPILVLMGGAVDISRYNRYKMELSNAVDAAGLALVRTEAERGEAFTDAEAKQFVVDYVNAFDIPDEHFTVGPSDFTVTRTGQGYAIDVTGEMKNLFLPIAELKRVEKKFDSMNVGVSAEVVRSSRNIELAMVLDVTGSMAGSKIDDLEDAATELIGIVVKPAAQQTPYYSKVAIVPYSMGVNAGDYADEVRGDIVPADEITNATWLTGSVKTIKSTSRENPVKVTMMSNHGFSSGDTVYITGVSRMTGLNGKAYKIANVTSTTFTLRTLSGQNVNGTGYSRAGSGGNVQECATSDCDVVVTASSHGFETNDRVYITDVGGLTSINDELFTITKIDSSKFELNGSGPGNNPYTSGGNAWCTELGCEYYYFTNASGSARLHQVSTCVSERTGTDAYKDTAPGTAKVGYNYPAPASSGNSCLTNTITPLSSDIAGLKAETTKFEAKGSTAGQIGVAWGWYMVSPNFASIWPNDVNRPAAYDAPDTIKVVVLMTDGAFNTPYCKGVIAKDAGSGSGSSSDHINCNATNGDPFAQAKSLCTAMKNKGIILYTVGFDVGSDEDARGVMSDCATDSDHVYFPESGTELKEAFKAIAQDVDSLRIAR